MASRRVCGCARRTYQDLRFLGQCSSNLRLRLCTPLSRDQILKYHGRLIPNYDLRVRKDYIFHFYIQWMKNSHSQSPCGSFFKHWRIARVKK
jgi:hypothetical protein